jgi:hypothetical protein
VVAGLRGAFRDTEGLGDLRHWQSDVVVEHHDGSVVDRQAFEAGLELVAVRDVSTPIRDGRFGARRLDGDLEPPPPVDLVLRGTDEDPVQPAVEAGDVAELGELAPAPDERLLDRILGEIRVAQHEPGDRVEAVHLARGELPERLAVTLPRSFDEVLSHRLHREGPASPGRRQ